MRTCTRRLTTLLFAETFPKGTWPVKQHILWLQHYVFRNQRQLSTAQIYRQTSLARTTVSANWGTLATFSVLTRAADDEDTAADWWEWDAERRALLPTADDRRLDRLMRGPAALCGMTTAGAATAQDLLDEYLTTPTTGPIYKTSYDLSHDSVPWRCWLGDRKGIRPVKNWVLGCWRGWLSVWSEVQTCIWPSWCHCHSLSLASVKSRLVLHFWYRLTRVVPDKGSLS